MGKLKELWQQFRQWQREPLHYKPLTDEKHVCLNCKQEFAGIFCPRCGQKAITEDHVGWKSLKDDFFVTFGLETGALLRTFWHLLWRPGYLINDYLSGNKSLSAWGVEGRVPFLDKEFLDVAMRTNPEAKMCPGTTMEKKIVREAFADMLPAEVAWRQKEQFSDGVGYSWIDTLKKITSEAVTDEQMAHAAERFPINPPKNKEEYYYRCIFAEHFPSDSAAKSVPSEASVACSTAIALEWDEAFKNMNEPSGRAVKGVHEQAY